MANVYGTLFDNGGAVYNVKHTDYGAVGNGTTDDKAAIQAAIDAAANAGGGVVYFPRGKYRITGALKLDTTVRDYASITFRGVGWGPYAAASSSQGSVIQLDATSGSALELGPSTGSGNPLFRFSMYDLGIMAKNTGYTGNLVKAYALGKCGFSNCGFYGIPDATSATATALFYGNFWVDLHFDRCNFATAVKGVEKAGLGSGFSDSVDNVSFDRCLFERCGTSVDIRFNTQSVAIERSTFEPAIGGAASPVSLSGESNKVQNCWFGDSNYTGTWVQMGQEAAIVSGNYISNAAVGVDLTSGAYDPEVSNNYITECATAVRAVSSGLKMRGNFIYVRNGTSTNPGLGLDLGADTWAKVESNLLLFSGSSVGDRVGYKLASGSKGVLEDLASNTAPWGSNLIQNSAGSAWVTLLPSTSGTTLVAPNITSLSLKSTGTMELQGYLTMTGSAGSPSTSTRFISDAGSSDTFFHNVPASGAFLFADGGTSMLQVTRGSTVDDDTALIVLRRKSGTWSAARVSEGAADSAGTGYRVLRVPN